MKQQTAVLATLTFVFILALPPFFLSLSGSANFLVPHFWMMFGFITGLTVLVVAALLVTQKVNPEKFAETFLAATVFKILACLAFLVIFILKNKVNKTAFVGDFFYLYFLNTAFEVYVLLRNLRNQNLK